MGKLRVGYGLRLTHNFLWVAVNKNIVFFEKKLCILMVTGGYGWLRTESDDF